ncbi:hypothetical protein [Vibrio fluminensis]|uniref:hypothetical protein n=1 Tax=Vibrio fluminensis TaxID=2783614 RepID=UPI001887AEC7|nr:hypothetical protein [Vibrio fluminensis]
MILGVVASFFGAFLQAINYVVTQRCQKKYLIDGVKLLVAIHIFMGIVALSMSIAFELFKFLPADSIWLFLKVNIPYLTAQYFLLSAIKQSDASIVSPLLALKVPVLALLALAGGQYNFSANQILSIVLIVMLAFCFSALSGRLLLKPLCYIFFASIGYSFSDVAITEFSHQLPFDLPIYQAFATICLNYSFCGLLALLFIRPFDVSLSDVWCSKWVALTWFVAVMFLILGFNLSGVVSGNIVQTLRGVIGVVIAFFLFRKVVDQPMKLWLKKLAIAFLMVFAVTIYYL